MFNKEGTEIFNRGLELLKSCEEVIQQLRLTNKIE
jgi:exonuclease VII small subunit